MGNSPVRQAPEMTDGYCFSMSKKAIQPTLRSRLIFAFVIKRGNKKSQPLTRYLSDVKDVETLRGMMEKKVADIQNYGVDESPANLQRRRLRKPLEKRILK